MEPSSSQLLSAGSLAKTYGATRVLRGAELTRCAAAS